MYFDDKVVILTGGNGFLGYFLKESLTRNGCQDIYSFSRSEFDLRSESAIKEMFADVKSKYPTKKMIVIHLAASVGGIGANRKFPGQYFYDNIMMGVQLIEQSRLQNVHKFVQLGTVCSYPKFTPVPFKERNLWDGFPEETNAPYGIAKKALLAQLQSYEDEYNFNSIYLIPVNLYGPRDNFHPEHSHVIPGLIQKIYASKINNEPSVTVWGSGNVSREFLFVTDAAEAIAIATMELNDLIPINIGIGQETTIKNLVVLIAELLDYKGQVVWDQSKPDGQPRRCLDVTRAKEHFGFTARVELREGLQKTIQWYVENRDSVVQK